MPDQNASPATETPAANTVSDELASSLCSVWARYAGARPTDTALEFDGHVIRWNLPQGLTAVNAGVDASGEGEGPDLTMTGYRRAASSAVAKVTHRKVSAHMSKLNKETGATTETFILEAITKKY